MKQQNPVLMDYYNIHTGTWKLKKKAFDCRNKDEMSTVLKELIVYATANEGKNTVNDIEIQACSDEIEQICKERGWSSV